MGKYLKEICSYQPSEQSYFQIFSDLLLCLRKYLSQLFNKCKQRHMMSQLLTSQQRHMHDYQSHERGRRQCTGNTKLTFLHSYYICSSASGTCLFSSVVEMKLEVPGSIPGKALHFFTNCYKRLAYSNHGNVFALHMLS
jgi:hypothetical protein